MKESNQMTPTTKPNGVIDVSTGDNTSCRVVIQEMIKGLRAGKQSREMSLAITKLQEAAMWLFEAFMGDDPDADAKDKSIIVNGRKTTANGGEISYEQVVSLAFSDADPRRIFSVTWKDGDRGGILSPGRKVPLRDGMIFSAADTSNA